MIIVYAHWKKITTIILRGIYVSIFEIYVSVKWEKLYHENLWVKIFLYNNHLLKQRIEIEIGV